MQHEGITPQPGDPGADRTYALPSAARALGLLLLAGYLLLVGWLLLRPLPVSWTYPANLTPFASVRQAAAVSGYAVLRQLADGLLPLAPLGVLLPVVGERLGTTWLPSLLRTLGGCTLLATALEIAESWVPGHVLNVDDVLLAPIGAAICHLALVPAGRALLLRRAARPPVAASESQPHQPALPVPLPGGLGRSASAARRLRTAGGAVTAVRFAQAGGPPAARGPEA